MPSLLDNGLKRPQAAPLFAGFRYLVGCTIEELGVALGSSEYNLKVFPAYVIRD